MAKAKSTRNARASARKKQQLQQQQFMLIGGGLIGVMAIVGVVIFLLNSRETDIPQLDDAQFEAYRGIPLDENSEADRDIELASDVAENVTRGFTEEGIPYIGALDAPIVIADFSDFSCPHCADFEADAERIIKDYVRQGLVRLEFYPMTFVGGTYSETAARGAICAGKQGAFWEFHSVLFDVQETEGARAFTRGKMEEIASGLGLDEDELGDCLNNSSQWRGTLTAAERLSSTLGVTGTPSTFYKTNDLNWQSVPASYGSISSIINQNLAQ